MSESKTGGALGLTAATVGFVLVLVFSITLLGDSAEAGCAPDGSGDSISIDPGAVPDTTIKGYSHTQLVNAAHIVAAGKDLSLGVRDQTIGVMTAMGESSLTVIDRGDAVGPDSRGLFQQRANGAWGSYEDRMDPYISSTNFFKALMTIKGRDQLDPTIAAHRTQINADPYHYERYWPAAVAVVEGLSGIDTGLISDSVSGCGEDGEVNQNGWAKPGNGPINGGFGPRASIQTASGSTYPFHFGLDLAGGGCDGPIWAAQEGTVSRIFTDGGGAWRVSVDHGGGITTQYVHMYDSGILVAEGDKVQAGQQIARVGSSGRSTGCHLHFEVHKDGKPIDPIAFLKNVGITY